MCVCDIWSLLGWVLLMVKYAVIFSSIKYDYSIISKELNFSSDDTLLHLRTPVQAYVFTVLWHAPISCVCTHVEFVSPKFTYLRKELGCYFNSHAMALLP